VRKYIVRVSFPLHKTVGGLSFFHEEICGNNKLFGYADRRQQQLIINMTYFIYRSYKLLLILHSPLCYVPLSQKRASTAVLIFIL